MNQALAFGALGTGGVLLISAITHTPLGDVLRGKIQPVSHTGQSLGGTGGGGTVADIAPSGARQGSVSMGQLQSIGASYGWSAGEIQAWWHVITAESGGNPNARNPSSGAYGIGQFLGDTLRQYAPFGATSSDPNQQLNAMARYIHDRYGTPSAAWTHEQANHWY